jgi:hypothetical protein
MEVNGFAMPSGLKVVESNATSRAPSYRVRIHASVALPDGLSLTFLWHLPYSYMKCLSYVLAVLPCL